MDLAQTRPQKLHIRQCFTEFTPPHEGLEGIAFVSDTDPNATGVNRNMITHLEGLGYTVTGYHMDFTSTTTDAELWGSHEVVIGFNIDRLGVDPNGQKYAQLMNIAVAGAPALLGVQDTFSGIRAVTYITLMNLAGEFEGINSSFNGTSEVVVDEDHPIMVGAGLSNGTVQILNSPSSLAAVDSGEPHLGSAITHGTNPSGSLDGQVSMFAISPGTMRIGGGTTTVERIVVWGGFFSSNLTADGDSILQAVLSWLGLSL